MTKYATQRRHASAPKTPSATADSEASPQAPASSMSAAASAAASQNNGIFLLRNMSSISRRSASMPSLHVDEGSSSTVATGRSTSLPHIAPQSNPQSTQEDDAHKETIALCMDRQISENEFNRYVLEGVLDRTTFQHRYHSDLIFYWEVCTPHSRLCTALSAAYLISYSIWSTCILSSFVSPSMFSPFKHPLFRVKKFSRLARKQLPSAASKCRPTSFPSSR